MVNEKFTGVFIHPTAEVASSARIGKGSAIWNQVQIREEAIIGVNCNLGKDVYIDIGVEIGNNVKIQNGVSVYHGVEVEDDVFLGPHMTFTNDLNPRAWKFDFEVHRTLIKKGASIGANSTILCGISIGEYALIGAGTVVCKNIPPYALVMGNPGQICGFVSKSGYRLDLFLEEDDKNLLMKCKKNGEKQIIEKRYISESLKKIMINQMNINNISDKK